MVEGRDLRDDLLARIVAKRASVQAHLRRHRPRSRRLATATIVLTSLAAVFTAGPGVGGDPFAAAVGNAIGTQSSGPVWQGLCLGAALLSASAAIVTGLSKSQEETAKLNIAAAVDCELEGLAFLVEFGEVSVEDAVKLYQQYIQKINFIEDDVAPVVVAHVPGGRTQEPEPAQAAASKRAPEPAQARRPRPADQHPPGADLPAVPPPSRRSGLRQTVLRQSPKDTTRRRLPPPSR